MSEQRITRRSLESLGRGNTDWARIDSQTDEDIEAAIRDDPDAAPIMDDSWFEKARLVLPRGKDPISIRLDRDVLEWFRSQDEPYQTRINAVLRAYMEHERAKSGK